ncbi:MAG: Hpt domain-containing protein [Pseudomonadota bacterium]
MSIKQESNILDYKHALKASAGKEQLANNLLALFIKQLTDYKQNIQTALDRHDLVMLQNNIHKLNGALQYIGAPSLSQQVSELDGQIKQLSENSLVIKVKHILYSLEQISIEGKYP